MKRLTTNCIGEVISADTRMKYLFVSLPNSICNCNKKARKPVGERFDDLFSDDFLEDGV